MKKFISILLCITLCISCVAFASSEYDSAISRVCGVGIMGNVEDGDFRADDTITRAEFTTVALRMLGVFSVSQAATSFLDVPSDHWASGAIAMASDMNLINGKGNGVFAPEDNVTFAEAAKIIICALGRDLVMTSKDFPNSYIATAGSLGITKGIEYSDAPLTRAQVAAMVDNALDINPLEPVYGTDKYEVSAETLYEKLVRIKDTNTYTGILTESANSSIKFIRECEDGYIMVDDKVFRSDKAYDEYIGQKVEVYYTSNGNLNKVVSLSPEADTNQIYTLQATDTVYENDKITYFNDEDKEKFYKLETNVIVLKNGDRITPPQRLEINLGEYLLIDNNDNNYIDVVSVTSGESFVVESVSVENNALYFDNNRTYHGRNGIVADNSDDEKEYIITDKDGNALNFSDINAGDAVSVIGNSDDSYVRLIVSSKSEQGSVEGIENDKVIINGSTYPIGKDEAGNYLISPYLGMEGAFVVDAFGYVIGTHGDTPDKFSYGYIADAKVNGTMDSSLQISLITGGEPQKDVKISNGDETVSYRLQNNEAITLTLADNVKFASNPIDAQGIKTNVEDILPDKVKGKIAGYTLDSKGKINALNVYSVPDNLPAYEFNADIFSFGGMRRDRGFIKNEATQIVCVPNVVRSDDDYGVTITITDEVDTYKVYGIKGTYKNTYGSLEANSEPADIIVLKADMDSSVPLVIPADNDICIVGKISNKNDENGDEVCVIELLNGSDKKVYSVSTDSPAYSQAVRLRKGDLIQFTTDSHNNIAGIRYKASVQGLTDYYSENESLYGLVDDIRYNVYDHFSNQMVDRMAVNVGNDIANIKLFRSEGQSIYLYDRKSGYIYPATSDDIMASNYYGEKASKVFAIMEENDATVIVLIKD